MDIKNSISGIIGSRYREHKFDSMPQAKVKQISLKKRLGYKPQIFKITHPKTKKYFYSIVEPK